MEWKEKCVLGGGLLLIASSAIISLAACSSFNLHKDNVIRNADTFVGMVFLINNKIKKKKKKKNIKKNICKKKVHKKNKWQKQIIYTLFSKKKKKKTD